MIRKIVYIFYFFKSSNYEFLNKEIENQVQQNPKLNKCKIWKNILVDSYKYKASFMDYFIFNFYEKTEPEKETYVTTGVSYEFFQVMNEKQYIKYFRNKELFNKEFKDYISRDVINISIVDESEFINWCQGKENIIIKPSKGVQGDGVLKQDVKSEDDAKEIFRKLNTRSDDTYIVEELIDQHKLLNELNPTSVNSIRIITVSKNNKVEIITAVLRIGTKSHIDNFSNGGIAAAINIKTGVVMGEAVTNYTNTIYEYHPITGFKIVGFKIPFWDEVVNLVQQAALVIPQVRTVGWDIAITNQGPELIEGNDNWGKDTFQLPYHEGRKHIIDKYIES